MEVKENFDLANLNTFHVPARAEFFVELNSEKETGELFNLPQFKNRKKMFLGGGSNILFTKDFDGLVILNKLKDIEILSGGEETVLVRSMSGVIWHDLVSFVVERGLWGIENLAYIPGTVGAAPVQNIGAYGAELKDVLESVEAYSIETGEKKIFTRDECEFGYRDSIFKGKAKGKYFISAITLKMSKTPKPNTSYRILSEFLKENKIEVKTSRDVCDAVTMIRKQRLPDPAEIGNAGSFFKNTVVEEERFKELLKIFPEMPNFPDEKGIKIPSAWLIEQAGYKGKRIGNVGVHTQHALILVNYGGGTGEEIRTLAEDIIKRVEEKFGITLSPEVNWI